MTIEATLERIAVALERQAAALEAPMAAIQAARAAAPAPAAAAPAPAVAEAPAKRGPGRPPKTEAQVTPAPVAAPAPAPAAVDSLDDLPGESDAGNFLDDEPAPPVVEILPTADDVRKALIKYGQRPGCSQEKARALLKQYGHVDTLKALKPEHFKAVIDAAGV
jgi:hypothetical protein